MNEVLEALLVFLALPVIYIAGKEKLIERFLQAFCEWANDLLMRNQSKNGLSPETKQTIYEDFMKNSKN